MREDACFVHDGQINIPHLLITVEYQKLTSKAHFAHLGSSLVGQVSW